MAGENATGAVPRQEPVLAKTIVNLLNTRPHATPRSDETLTDPEAANLLLQPLLAQPLAEDDLPQVRALRDGLVEVVGRFGAEDAWVAVNQPAASVAFHPMFGDGRVELRQVSGSPAVGAVVRAIADLVAAGTFSRIRLCANTDCSHAFYDSTRSRTQRWHSYEICGNRVNVATYRKRTKHSK
ncbi:CGNR zinc finger domain-containing protein [Amycolatopsis sp. NPDC049253]|uniref:CGNR zinc finger domain-containing protein n=1 Tax=Amycolatopsis sp. NPDC049253 TaxID=3155274 RepID=UPI00341EED9E